MAKKLLIMANMLIAFAFIGVLAAFAQVPDVTAPVISGVSATGITQAAATVNWTTDEAADGQVEYGTSTAYGLSSSLVTATSTAHSVSLTGITASTTYHYLVKSKDDAGNLATSTDYTFTTLAPTATTTAAVAVKVKVEPRTLNTKTKGKWIEAEVKFPQGYDASAIDISSIKLNGVLAPVKIKVKKAKWHESFSSRKTAKVEMKFSRADVVALLSATATSTTSTATSTAPTLPLFSLVKKEVIISGNVGADTFSGTTTVRVLIKNVVSAATIQQKNDDDHRKEERRREHAFPSTATSTAATTATAATTTAVTVLPLRHEGKKEVKEQQKEKKEVKKENEKKDRD